MYVLTENDIRQKRLNYPYSYVNHTDHKSYFNGLVIGRKKIRSAVSAHRLKDNLILYFMYLKTDNLAKMYYLVELKLFIRRESVF